MKQSKMIQILTGLTITLASGLLVTGHAYGGAGSSGGGDAVILPDDTVILADPYIAPNGIGFNLNDLQLHEKLLAELNRIDRFFSRMGAANFKYSTQFFRENITGDRVEYRFTDSLPTDCDWAAVGPTPGVVEHIACTTGPLTLIRGDLFKKMNVREQAKLIVHERLRALSSPAAPAEYIAEITGALETMLDLYNQQLSGKRPVLTQPQVDQLENFRKRILQLDLDLGGPTFYRSSADKPTSPAVIDVTYEDENSLRWLKVTPNGGGLISVAYDPAKFNFPINTSASAIDPSAYIGIGSIMLATDETETSGGLTANHAYINQGATLLDVDCFHTSCKISQNALVNGYSVTGYSHPFEIDSQASITFEDGAVFDHSHVTAKSFVQHANSVVRNTLINEAGSVSLGAFSSIENSHLNGGSLTLGDQSSIKNTENENPGELNLILGKNSQLQNISFPYLRTSGLNPTIFIKDTVLIDGSTLPPFYPDLPNEGAICKQAIAINGFLTSGSLADLQSHCVD